MADANSMARAQALFGRLAVERGYITTQQLEQAIRLQQQLGGTSPLGSILVQRGFLSLSQVQELIAVQRQFAEARPAPPAGPSMPPAARPAAPASPPVMGARPMDPPVMEGRGAPIPVRPSAVAAPAAVARTATPMQVPPVPAAAARPVTPGPAAPAPAAVPAPPPEPAAPKTPPELAPLLPVGSRAANRVAAMIDAAERRRASDIHFHSNVPPVLRIEGKLGVLHEPPLDPKDLERDLMALLSDELRKTFVETGDLDFAYVSPSGLRTRANIYRAHSGVDATFRILPRGPQTLEELNLPGTLAKLIGYHQGLVLVTGPAGSGKSTTLSALVNLLNEERAEHILMLEDPIEIVHPEKRALINQRQVRRDTESFARALRGALREDPDIIVIGDLRDRETISLAITAAETGHLVIGSMNTNNAARTVGRLIDAFPPVQQAQVRAMLSESLRGVVSQKLLPMKNGRRAPVIELLFNTAAMGNVIRKGELFQLRSQMQVGRSLGMRTFDESLRELVLADKLDAEEARKHAESAAAIPSGGAPPPPIAAPAAPAPNAAAPMPAPAARQPLGMPPKPIAPAAPGPVARGAGLPRPGSRS